MEQIAEAVERDDICFVRNKSWNHSSLGPTIEKSVDLCKRLLKRTVRLEDDASRHHQLDFSPGG